MCVGSIAVLAEAWLDGAARVGRLEDGCVVPLSFVPDADPGCSLLLHMGIPVEVLAPQSAAEALELRVLPDPGQDGGGAR
jgi:hypothetical protein